MGRLMPSLFASLTFWTPFTPFLLLSMTLYGVKYLFGYFRWSSWLCPLLASCATHTYAHAHTHHPFTVVSEWETDKVLALCKHCSATAKALVCYQRYFGTRSTAWHLTGCCKEANSVPARRLQFKYIFKAYEQGNGLISAYPVSYQYYVSTINWVPG